MSGTGNNFKYPKELGSEFIGKWNMPLKKFHHKPQGKTGYFTFKLIQANAWLRKKHEIIALVKVVEDLLVILQLSIKWLWYRDHFQDVIEEIIDV
jgi:hypothetical protein